MTHATCTQTQLFSLVEPFHKAIFTEIKNDIKQHLRVDRSFFKKNFPHKKISSLTVEDFLDVYPRVIKKGPEEIVEPLVEYLLGRWLLRHAHVYTFFEAELKKLNPSIEKITHIDDLFARPLIDQAVSRFGASTSYIFSVLNGVAFSESVLQGLRQCATK